MTNTEPDVIHLEMPTSVAHLEEQVRTLLAAQAAGFQREREQIAADVLALFEKAQAAHERKLARFTQGLRLLAETQANENADLKKQLVKVDTERMATLVLAAARDQVVEKETVIERDSRNLIARTITTERPVRKRPTGGRR